MLVWKLGRGGRSVSDCIRSIQELVALGVRFLAVTQNIDTDEKNLMARFMLYVLAALGELMIREHVLTDLRNVRAKGKVLGRLRRILRRNTAVELYNPGKSCREAAEIPGVPVSTVYTACRSKNLPGE